MAVVVIWVGVTLYFSGLPLPLRIGVVLLAAIGLPDVRKPDGTEMQPDMMVGLRRGLNLYAAVRPVKLFPGVQKHAVDTEIDGGEEP